MKYTVLFSFWKNKSKLSEKKKKGAKVNVFKDWEKERLNGFEK